MVTYGFGRRVPECKSRFRGLGCRHCRRRLAPFVAGRHNQQIVVHLITSGAHGPSTHCSAIGRLGSFTPNSGIGSTQAPAPAASPSLPQYEFACPSFCFYLTAATE